MPECKTNSDGITLELIVGILKKHKWLMLLSLILSGFVSAAAVMFSPQTYHARCVMFTEEHSYVAESMKMIAKMQGIDVGNINTAEDAIYPIYYPELLFDGRMQSYVLNSRVTGTDGKSCPYGQHIRKDQTRLRPKDLDATHPTQLTDSLQKVLMKNVKIMVDGKTFVITIDVKDDDAMVAYTMCDSVERYIARTIREYRADRLGQKLEHLEKVEENLAKRTNEAYEVYTDYADKHQQATLPSVSKHTDELFKEAENLKALTEAVRLERINAAARMNDGTPPYIIIEKPSVPSHRQGMDATFTIISTMFVLFLAVMLCFLARPIYEQIKA